MHDLVIRNGTVVTPLSAQKLDIGIDGESISALGSALPGRRFLNADNMLVFPGVIDAHTHMDLPVAGTRSSDDFYTGTVAAAFGGVTSIMDFTVGSPSSSIALDIDRRLDDIQPAVIDVGLHAEVIGWKPEDSGQFTEARRRGVTSFKFFTAYESSGRRTAPAVMRRAFEHLADLDCVALVHCEDEELIRSIMDSLSPEQMTDMSVLAQARPDLCESTAISQVGRVSLETGCRVHIVHVSSAKGLSAVQDARKAGAAMTAETCPQYLVLGADSYGRMDGHMFAASPALRTLADQLALWKGLKERTVDIVATDHCPFTREQKAWQGSFVDLPYGLPGVETLLPILYSEGVGKGVLAVTDIPRLLSEGPARIYGLDGHKGAIEAGMDADLVVFDPSHEWEMEAPFLHMRTDFSPYEGWTITGKPVSTVSRGEIIVQDGELLAQEGRGKFLFRTLP